MSLDFVEEDLDIRLVEILTIGYKRFSDMFFDRGNAGFQILRKLAVRLLFLLRLTLILNLRKLDYEHALEARI